LCFQPCPFSRHATFLDCTTRREEYRGVSAAIALLLYFAVHPLTLRRRGVSFTVPLCAILADATPATSSSHRINGSGSGECLVASSIILFLRVPVSRSLEISLGRIRAREKFHIRENRFSPKVAILKLFYSTSKISLCNNQ